MSFIYRFSVNKFVVSETRYNLLIDTSFEYVFHVIKFTA